MPIISRNVTADQLEAATDAIRKTVHVMAAGGADGGGTKVLTYCGATNLYSVQVNDLPPSELFDAESAAVLFNSK